MMPDEGAIPELILTCIEGDECLVYFEPWGSEHILRKGDAFTVRTLAIATSNVEISFVKNGIIVGISSDAPISVTDNQGKELPI